MFWRVAVKYSLIVYLWFISGLVLVFLIYFSLPYHSQNMNTAVQCHNTATEISMLENAASTLKDQSFKHRLILNCSISIHFG